MENHAAPYAENEFTELYARNIDLVYRICYLYLKNPADAEDAAQSVFLKILQGPLRFHDGAHERAWCITAAKNACKDILKSWWVQRRVDLASLPEPAWKNADTQEKDVMTHLFALPSRYRITLYLYYVEGYAVKEIAALIGRNESTIRSQLQRGREKLKKALGGDYLGQSNCKQHS